MSLPGPIAWCGVNLTRIGNGRNLHHVEEQTSYLALDLDLEGHRRDSALVAGMGKLHGPCLSLKIPGFYPRAATLALEVGTDRRT